MGEENKVGEGEEKKVETKQEGESGGDDEILVKVDMHCEACIKKVVRSLTTFKGVESVAINGSDNMVMVKSKTADPAQVCERIRKKSGCNVQLLSPLPPKPDEPQQADESPKDDHEDKGKDQTPPSVKTIELRVQMHCEACAQILRKHIRKMKGVESVVTDVGKDQVTVKGVIVDATTLAEYVYKRTKKQAVVIGVKDDSIADDDDQKKKLQETVDDQVVNKGREGDDQNENERIRQLMMSSRSSYTDQYWLPNPTIRPNYNDNDNDDHYVYVEYNNFNYQPHVFSDENPNACSIM